MKKDIENRTDIELLVNIFYAKVLEDKQLGFIFEKMAKVNWATHLPAMYNFWDNIILCSGTYEGNPMDLHKRLRHITPLNKTHFDKWEALFISSVDELFEGKNAKLAKQRAIGISCIIKEKIWEYQQSIKSN